MHDLSLYYDRSLTISPISLKSTWFREFVNFEQVWAECVAIKIDLLLTSSQLRFRLSMLCFAWAATV